MFEWDESKRRSTIEKHGIDFIDAIEVFQADHLILDARSDTGHRRLAVGMLGNVTIAVVFTKREENLRIITARKARKNERLSYEALLAGRSSQAEE